MLTEEQKETVIDMAQESNPECFIVTYCPACGKHVVLEPTVKAFNESMNSFKHGRVECECGRKIWPVLSVHSKNDENRVTAGSKDWFEEHKVEWPEKEQSETNGL